MTGLAMRTRRFGWEDALYRWIDRRGKIPSWALLLWPRAHWCREMDDLLITWNTFDCFCDLRPKELS